MNVSEIFDALLQNLKVGDAATVIAARRDEITKTLNKDFRSVEGCNLQPADGRLLRPAHGHRRGVRPRHDLHPPGLAALELRQRDGTAPDPQPGSQPDTASTCSLT